MLRLQSPDLPVDGVWSFHVMPRWEDRSRLLVRTRLGMRMPGEALGAEAAGSGGVADDPRHAGGHQAPRRAELAADFEHVGQRPARRGRRRLRVRAPGRSGSATAGRARRRPARGDVAAGLEFGQVAQRAGGQPGHGGLQQNVDSTSPQASASRGSPLGGQHHDRRLIGSTSGDGRVGRRAGRLARRPPCRVRRPTPARCRAHLRKPRKALSTIAIRRDRSCRSGAVTRSAGTPRPAGAARCRVAPSAPPCSWSTVLRSTGSNAGQLGGGAKGSRSVWRSRMASARARCASVTSSNGVNEIVARWSRSLGLGKRSTSACQPAAETATRRWSRTAPQLMIASRPLRSVACGTRWGSKNSFSSPPSTTQCQGWLLCTDGARHARLHRVRHHLGIECRLDHGQPPPSVRFQR